MGVHDSSEHDTGARSAVETVVGARGAAYATWSAPDAAGRGASGGASGETNAAAGRQTDRQTDEMAEARQAIQQAPMPGADPAAISFAELQRRMAT